MSEETTSKAFDSETLRDGRLPVPPPWLGHPRYRVISLLGRGGMGAVYKAEQLLLKREVALKVVSPELTRFPSIQRQFFREVGALGRLVHSNIVGIYDADSVGDLCFL